MLTVLEQNGRLLSVLIAMEQSISHTRLLLPPLHYIIVETGVVNNNEQIKFLPENHSYK